MSNSNPDADDLQIIEPEESAESFRKSLEEIDALLGRLEATTPASTLAVGLKHEVNELLGRPPAPPAPAPAPVRATPADTTEPSADDLFDWFGRLVEAWPVLDSDRVARAAEAVEVGLFAEERLARIEEDSDLAKQMRRRDLADLHDLADRGRSEFKLLIVSNLRLVFHWSKGVARSVNPDWAQDAFQAGCIGLIRGLQSWDYRRGYQLSTFVSWHIRQAIQRWRANEIMVIRLPVHIWTALETNTTTLSEEQIKAVGRARNLESLDVLNEDDPDAAWDGGLDANGRHHDLARIIGLLLDGLDEREGNVLRLRHGIGSDGEPMTLDAIGEIYNVTRERIRQIETKALEKLRARTSAAYDETQLLLS